MIFDVAISTQLSDIDASKGEGDRMAVSTSLGGTLARSLTACRGRWTLGRIFAQHGWSSFLSRTHASVSTHSLLGCLFIGP